MQVIETNRDDCKRCVWCLADARAAPLIKDVEAATLGEIRTYLVLCSPPAVNALSAGGAVGRDGLEAIKNNRRSSSASS